MKLKSLHLAVIILVFIFGGIAITSALGFWETINDKVPATYEAGDFKGQYDPADIRGSYTFGDISNAFEIPLEDLSNAFGLNDPAKFASFQCKELETIYAQLAAEGMEVGISSIRYFVALYKGLPINAEEGTYLPKSGIEILRAKAKLTEEQINIIEQYSVDLLELSTAPSASTPAPEKLADDKVIKGSTTFKELIDWGVRKEDIENIITDKIPDVREAIKDYASTKGIEFITLKGPLQKLVDSISK